MERLRRVDAMISVPAMQVESFAEVLAAEALVRLCQAPARAVDSLHLKVGTAMI